MPEIILLSSLDGRPSCLCSPIPHQGCANNKSYHDDDGDADDDDDDDMQGTLSGSPQER